PTPPQQLGWSCQERQSPVGAIFARSPAALLLRALYARLNPLRDRSSLELGDRAQDKHLPVSGQSCRIDISPSDTNTMPHLELLEQKNQVSQIEPETTEGGEVYVIMAARPTSSRRRTGLMPGWKSNPQPAD